MAAFVEGWVVMSGPASAKSGMQGESLFLNMSMFVCLRFCVFAGNMDANNGCNCIYDEMMDELTEGDGTDRTECAL